MWAKLRVEALHSLSRLQIIHTHTHHKSAWKLLLPILYSMYLDFCSYLLLSLSFLSFFFLHLHKMTKSLPHSPKQNKPPDPIITSTSNLSKSSLASSAASLSPSTSILLSAAANRTFVPSSRNSSYRKTQPPIMPLPSSSSISTSSTSSNIRNAKLESIIQVRFWIAWVTAAGLLTKSRISIPKRLKSLYNQGYQAWRIH